MYTCTILYYSALHMHVHIINNNTVVAFSFNNLVLDMYYSTQFYYVQLHAFTFFFYPQ